MREIKFKQPILINEKFKKWHYWGFLSERIFVGPYNATEPSYQYTGLKDKHGKEIYEGDIVKKHDTIEKYNNALGVIKHEARWMQFQINVIVGHEWSFEYPDGPHWSFEDIEIIGNIWENPDLLEGG